MLTARLGEDVVRAGANLASKRHEFVFRCRDKACEFPELELVLGRGVRVPYFRHKRRGTCGCPDGETDWHREWKSHFDKVEVDMGVDPVTGERNRADAVVGEDVVLEFQHSHIDEKEQNDRERFYGSKGGMVWIFDASGKRHRARIEKALSQNWFIKYPVPPFDKEPYFRLVNEQKVLPDLWVRRPRGVVFDYGKDMDLLYVLPDRDGRSVYALCMWYKRETLIDKLKTAPHNFCRSEAEMLAEYEAAQRAEEEKKAAEQKRKEQKLVILKAAWEEAKKRQATMRYPHMALQPVAGTTLAVGSNGVVYDIKSGRLDNQIMNLNPAHPRIAHRRRFHF